MDDLSSKLESLEKNDWPSREAPYWILSSWDGKPLTKCKFFKRWPELRRQEIIKIDKAIEEASAAEALTSKHFYVRKAKEWFLKQQRR